MENHIGGINYMLTILRKQSKSADESTLEQIENVAAATRRGKDLGLKSGHILNKSTSILDKVKI